MGYIRHHAIVVTGWDDDRVRIAHEQARRLLEQRTQDGIAHLPDDVLTPIIDAHLNGYTSFAILPDGSKEFWGDSDEMDTIRAAFLDWLESQRDEEGGSYLRWAEVIFGDEDGPARITQSSDGPGIEKTADPNP